MTGGSVSLRGLVKEFDDVRAVDGLSLDIGAGEFFSLLGESGCGKTTTLRLVAGFEDPDAVTLFGEAERGHTATETAADHHHVIVGAGHLHPSWPVKPTCY